MIGSASGPPDSGIERPGPWSRSFFTRKLFAGSRRLHAQQARRFGQVGGAVDEALVRDVLRLEYESPWRPNVEWHDGSAQLVCRTRCTLLKERMPLRFEHAPSAVQASASAIG
jgi:hypothetical protein